MPKRIDPSEYYQPCTNAYASVNNLSAQKVYFEETEPDGEQPHHQKIMHVLKAEAIMQKFITQLTLDVLRNSAYSWRKGTPLPAQGSRRQPLAEGEWKELPDNNPNI